MNDMVLAPVGCAGLWGAAPALEPAAKTGELIADAARTPAVAPSMSRRDTVERDVSEASFMFMLRTIEKLRSHTRSLGRPGQRARERRVEAGEANLVHPSRTQIRTRLLRSSIARWQAARVRGVQGKLQFDSYDARLAGTIRKSARSCWLRADSDPRLVANVPVGRPLERRISAAHLL